MPAKKSAQKKNAVKKAKTVSPVDLFPAVPTVRMNIELRTEWCDALRSGMYKQGKSVLCNKEDPEKPTYCCLGVLADILVKKDVLKIVPAPEEVQALNHNKHAVYYSSTHPDHDQARCSGSLPTEVALAIGLADADSTRDHQSRLINLNDTQQKSFEHIADYIFSHV